MRALSCALFAIPMWKGDLCGESMFVFMSRPSERIMRFSHSVSLFCLSGMKKSSACVSKALIVLSASSLQKKNFQKKFLTVDHLAHMSMKDAAKCEN